ncbi:MAG: rod shape-determining protein, partial [Muribaculaceae bacterium]|nr:rod shape-determining protein [Muribaculaceae bacterium]
NLNRVIVDRLKLEPVRFIVTPLAIADCVLSREEKALGCMLVDFGAETTTTVICKGGALKYLITLPMGSRNITRDLMSLNYLEDQAESFKRSIGIIPTGHDVRIADQPAISNYIEARASEIVANVLAQIEYAGLQPSDLPSGIIVTGGGSRLKGLSEKIAEQSKMTVRLATSPRCIRLSDTSVLADNSIDIISLLLEAAKNNPVDSLSEVIVAPAPQVVPDEEQFYSEEDDFGDDSPRMGTLDDEPIGDDQDFPGESRQRVVSKQQDRQKRLSKSRFSVLKDRVSRIFNSEFDDRFDSEE